MNALFQKMKSGLGRKPKDPLAEQWAGYHQWTPTVWLGSNSIHTFSSMRNLFIASMGLVGETGEVLQACEIAGDVDQLMEKELGDCVYYLSILCHMFTVPPKTLLEGAAASDTVPANPVGATDPAQTLAKVAFMLTETLKKYVRDSAEYDSAVDRWQPNAAVIEGFQRYWQAWLAVVQSRGLSVQLVFELNIDKLEGRKTRGTLRGSGDLR